MRRRIYTMVRKYDVIIIGAGASGMMAAATLIKRNKTVAVLEMGERPGRKISVSGGGRCNITNADANYHRYFGKNPNFTRSALTRFRPLDILEWAKKHQISIVEKTPGRYFCENGADVVLNALVHDVRGADLFCECVVTDVHKENNIFTITTNQKTFLANSVIVATGGVSFESLGVSDIGYKIAKKFGHKIEPIRPGLCAIDIQNLFPVELSGISVDAEIKIDKNIVQDSMLITHLGIGGPCAYRTSLYSMAHGITINLAPGVDVFDVLKNAKHISGRKNISGVLGQILPTRLAKWIAGNDNRNIADVKDTELKQIAQKTQNIFVEPDKIKLHSLRDAEITYGGVSTELISSKTMESKLCSGLFFVGEILDISGDLGGFNLHWAWASGFVAGENA